MDGVGPAGHRAELQLRERATCIADDLRGLCRRVTFRRGWESGFSNWKYDGFSGIVGRDWAVMDVPRITEVHTVVSTAMAARNSCSQRNSAPNRMQAETAWNVGSEGKYDL